MPEFNPIAVQDKCPCCGSGNYHWKAHCRLEGGNLVVECLKCLMVFITTENIFMKRAQKTENREPGQEG